MPHNKDNTSLAALAALTASRGPSTAPLWTNASLHRPDADYTIDLPQSPREPDNPENDVEARLASAREFLARPSRPNVLTPQDDADSAARQAWDTKNREAGVALADRMRAEQHGPVRRTTEGMSRLGSLAGLASLPLMAAGPEASGGALLAGGLLSLPDALRRAYFPQDDENRPGVGEALLTGSALLPGVGMARKAGEAATLAEEAPRLRQATHVPYRYPASPKPEPVMGRTTGHFKEGPGGLADVAAGRIKPSPMPPGEPPFDVTLPPEHRLPPGPAPRTPQPQFGPGAWTTPAPEGPLSGLEQLLRDRATSAAREVDLTDELNSLPGIRPSIQAMQAGSAPENLLLDPSHAVDAVADLKSLDPFIRRAAKQRAVVTRKLQEKQHPLPASWQRFKSEQR